MGVIGDLLLSLVGLAVVLAAPLEVAFAALIAFWLLVPGTLIVPHAPHVLLVDRLVLYGFALRFVLRCKAGEPTGAAFSLSPVHAALGVLLVVGFFDGVVFASADQSLASNLHAWLSLLDLVVLFVVVLAAIRAIGPRRSVAIIACVVAVAVLIGLEERFFHHGWAHFFFEKIPAYYLEPGSGPLGVRGGHVRSQGGAQFALEYGWVLAALAPLVVVAALRWARPRWRWSWLVLLFPLVLFVSVLFSGSRSAELAAVIAAVGVVLLIFLTGKVDRSILVWGGIAIAAGALFAVLDPSLVSAPFSGGASDPASVRLDRLPPLFALVVGRPFTGLGFNGISSYFGGLDDAYALVYATLGALGVLAWVTVMVTAFASTLRALRSRDADIRAIGAACLVGVVALAVAAASYDLVNTPQSSWAIVILAALGTVVAETVPRRVRLRRRWLARTPLPLAGTAIGFLVFAATPVTASQTLSVFTVAPWVPGPVYISQGQEMVDTLCATITNPDTIAPGTSVQCLLADSIFQTDYAGLALVTVRGPTPSAVLSEDKRAFTPIFRYMAMEGGPTSVVQTGKPSWAKTAPLSGGFAGLVAMFLVPPLRLKRRTKAKPRFDNGSRMPPDPIAHLPTPHRELLWRVGQLHAVKCVKCMK